jgi:hypothetical protein
MELDYYSKKLKEWAGQDFFKVYVQLRAGSNADALIALFTAIATNSILHKRKFFDDMSQILTLQNVPYHVEKKVIKDNFIVDVDGFYEKWSVIFNSEPDEIDLNLYFHDIADILDDDSLQWFRGSELKSWLEIAIYIIRGSGEEFYDTEVIRELTRKFLCYLYY